MYTLCPCLFLIACFCVSPINSQKKVTGDKPVDTKNKIEMGDGYIASAKNQDKNMAQDAPLKMSADGASPKAKKSSNDAPGKVSADGAPSEKPIMGGRPLTKEGDTDTRSHQVLSKGAEILIDGYNEIRQSLAGKKGLTDSKVDQIKEVNADSNDQEEIGEIERSVGDEAEVKGVKDAPLAAEVDVPIKIIGLEDGEQKEEADVINTEEVDVPLAGGTGKADPKPVNIWLNLMLFLGYRKPQHGKPHGKEGAVTALLVRKGNQEVAHLQHIEQQLCQLNQGVEKIRHELMDMAFGFSVIIMITACIVIIMLVGRILSKRNKMRQQRKAMISLLPPKSQRKLQSAQRIKRGVNKAAPIKETKITIDKDIPDVVPGATLDDKPVTPVPVSPSAPNSHVDWAAIQGIQQADEVTWASTQTVSPCSAPPPPGAKPDTPACVAPVSASAHDPCLRTRFGPPLLHCPSKSNASSDKLIGGFQHQEDNTV